MSKKSLKKIPTRVKFADVNSSKLVQVIDMDDYFGSGIPKPSQPMPKSKFVSDYLDDGDYSFKDWCDSSGDGDSNHVLLTTINNVICSVVN